MWMVHDVRCEWRGGEFQDTLVAVDTSVRLHDLTQKFMAVHSVHIQFPKWPAPKTSEVTTEWKKTDARVQESLWRSLQTEI